ncbi:MAG: hypothetical protein WC915_01005 [archaeon]|jgi:hypothetical protein
MNFPVGDIIAKAYLPVNFNTISSELEKINFNGYIIQSVKGSVIEEGVLFFRDGKINACIVECKTSKITLKANEAFNYFLNETKGQGFFQTVKLTRTQVDLVTAFDEKILIKSEVNLKELAKLIPDSFTDKFNIPVEKEDVLNKYGLGSLK